MFSERGFGVNDGDFDILLTPNLKYGCKNIERYMHTTGLFTQLMVASCSFCLHSWRSWVRFPTFVCMNMFFSHVPGCFYVSTCLSKFICAYKNVYHVCSHHNKSFMILTLGLNDRGVRFENLNTHFSLTFFSDWHIK